MRCSVVRVHSEVLAHSSHGPSNRPNKSDGVCFVARQASEAINLMHGANKLSVTDEFESLEHSFAGHAARMDPHDTVPQSARELPAANYDGTLRSLELVWPEPKK